MAEEMTTKEVEASSDSTSSNSPKKATTSNDKSDTQKQHGTCKRYLGVVPLHNGKYGAQIYTPHSRVWFGTFKTAEEAAKVYDVAAMKLRSYDPNRTTTTTEVEAPSSSIAKTEALDSTSSNSPKKATTSYMGVVPQHNGKFGAQIYTNQSRIWLGTFKTIDDAAKAYDIAAMKLRSSSNIRNFPRDDKSHLELEFIDQSPQESLLTMIKDGTYETKFAEFLRSKA